MISFEEKIAGLSKLLATNILTSEEFNKIVELLKGIYTESVPQTEESIKYNTYFTDFVLPKFKAPATANYPPFNDSMIQTVEGFFKTYKVIETYLDSQNSFGANIRTGIRIKIDDNFNYLGLMIKNAGAYSAWVSV